MKIFYSLILGFLLSLSILGCHGKNTGNHGFGEDDKPGDKIYITDRTGKNWDVTHAVENYGFETGNFQYGLGPYAIMPINNPEMISPGKSNYPDDNSTETIIGLNIDGDARAYPIRILSRHEVVNDRVGDKNVAVVY